MIAEATLKPPRNGHASDSYVLNPELPGDAAKARSGRSPKAESRFSAEFAEAKPFLVAGVSYTTWTRDGLRAPVQLETAAMVCENPAVAPPQAAAASRAGADHGPIRQLALRAIFGVSRELGEAEILELAAQLPGIRHLARIDDHEIGVIDSACRILTGMGLGEGAARLVAGSTPLQVIREGGVTLVVGTEGGFAPGVRESLLIVARELSRL